MGFKPDLNDQLVSFSAYIILTVLIAASMVCQCSCSFGGGDEYVVYVGR